MTEIEDTLALRRLADVYCSAVDDGDDERMASLFSDDGRLVVYPPGAWPGEAEPLDRGRELEHLGLGHEPARDVDAGHQNDLGSPRLSPRKLRPISLLIGATRYRRMSRQ